MSFDIVNMALRTDLRLSSTSCASSKAPCSRTVTQYSRAPSYMFFLAAPTEVTETFVRSIGTTITKQGSWPGNVWHFEQDPCNMTSRQRYETLTCTSTKTIEITRAWEFFMMSDHSKHISCIKLWVHMRVPSAKQLRSPFQVSLHLGFWIPSFLFSNCHRLLWCYDPLHFIDKPLLKSK